MAYDHPAQRDALVLLAQYVGETTARLDSYQVELEYMEKHRITVEDYRSALQQHGTGIVLL